MKAILDLLRRPEPKAADLRREIAGLPADDSAATIAALEKDRRSMLLAGLPGSDIEAVERKIADAIRERDRTIAFREELTGRLVIAEQAEAMDALAARKEAAEKESKAVAREYDAFDSLLGRLFDMIRRERTNHAECHAIDLALAAVGSTDRVERTSHKNPGYNEAVISNLIPAAWPNSEQTK